MGLYLQISIVFLLCLTLVSILYLIIKSNIKEIMHDKIVQFIEKKRFIVISKGSSKVKVGRKKQKTRPIQFITISAFVIIVLISNILTINKSKILNMYNKLENICVIGEIVNLEKQNDYYMIYKVSVKNINESNIRKKSYVLVKIKKNNKDNFKLGDIIKVNGKIENPDEQKNYRGFNYKRYLQGKNIATVVVGDTAYKLNKTNKKNIYYIKNKIIENVEKILAENNKERINNKNNIENKNNEENKKNNSSICLALIIGYKASLADDINEYFSESNLLHMLSISGMHISYICLIINFLLRKINKKIAKILTIGILIFYIFLTGGIPSVIRACITQILFLTSTLFYRKSNIYTNLSVASIIILIINPFSIFDIGFILSYLGTISILVFYKHIEEFVSILQIKLYSVFKPRLPREKSKIAKRFNKIIFYMKETVIISISANILIIPVTMYFFNTISLSFVLSNLLATPILVCVIIFSLIFFIVSFCSIKLGYFLAYILNFTIDNLINIVRFCSYIPFNKILICSPNILEITLIYTFIFVITFLYKKDKLNIKYIMQILNKVKKRNIKKLLVLACIFIIMIVFIYKNYNNRLKIFFIDVGQGDSTLIITPKNKKILIDGGGSEFGKFNIGEKILMPYLLNRKIKKIDYIIISHFDTDHCGGLLYVMEKIKVNNVIIGKQNESSDNYEKFKKIVKNKKINIRVVEMGDILKIEDELYFEVLWPMTNKMISENSINNNSLVCKMNYKKNSILFTGDIEEIAEKKILELYSKNLGILKADILKVGHHGSKTSSSLDFINAINPKYALIGVGKDNKFGHPSNIIINRLENKNVNILRTDQNGEISIFIKNKKIRIKKFIEK